MGLKGKTAIVTGAASERGIGFAIARGLVQRGANVVLTDIGTTREDLSIPEVYTITGDASELDSRVSELRRATGHVVGMSVDVTEKMQIEQCVELAEKHFGGIDILFNNAGTIVGAGPLLHTTDSQWELQYRIHVLGAANFTKMVLPIMKIRGGGAIVNISSNWATRIRDRASIYGATKLALIALTKSTALEFGKDNIRCNAVLPGPIVTNINDARARRMFLQQNINEDDAREAMAAPISLGRLGSPTDVAEAAIFLASEGASFITGIALPVDGGDTEGL